MPLMRDLLLKLLSFVFFFSASLEVYAVEKETWSAQKAQNLITRINTTEDIEAFYEFGRSQQNCLVSPSQRSQLKITALPQEIYDGQNDMKATWFFIMVLNGYTDFISSLEELTPYVPLAQNNLGFCYELGKGVAKDLEKAFKLYTSAADQGVAEAQCFLGLYYELGKGVAIDLEKAFKFYTSAANQGLARAQYNLGLCYEYGKGVAINLEKAIDLYTSTAAQGYAKAQNKLGFYYALGIGVAKDLEKAIQLCTSAANQGLAAAQYNLGFCYELGKGVAKDLEKAFKLYTSAADQGLARAQIYLGICYEEGKGVAIDLKKAIQLYTSAADQGLAEAQNYLGICYEMGKGVAIDLEKAIQLYTLAATEGLAEAQYNLGLCYEEGKGIAENPLEAVKLYILASSQGIEYAQTSLTALMKFSTNGHKQADLSPELMDSISILKGNLEDLLNDTFYWTGFSQNTSFKDAVALMPVLHHKATALSQFYQSMLNLLPLLKSPDFAVTCFKIQNKKLEKYLETYQNSNKYYFSFDSTYQNFKKGYEAKKTAALTLIAEMNLGLEKAAQFITLPACEVSDHLDQLKRGGNLELVQFLEPMLYPYIKASTLQEQDQARINLQRFINDFTTRLTKHKEFFTDLGKWEETDPSDRPMAEGFVNFFKDVLSLFKVKETSSPLIIGFKEVFEDLIVKTAPYRNHLFIAKYPIGE